MGVYVHLLSNRWAVTGYVSRAKLSILPIQR